MATSVYAFRGVVTPTSANDAAYVEFTFDPPSNISGKGCYVQCTFFDWQSKTEPTPVIDSLAFGSSWAQVCSGTVVDGKSFTLVDPYQDVSSTFKNPGRAPMGILANKMFFSTGPVLCSIPSGPHRVTFNVYRPDGEDISGGDQKENLFYACFKFVAADSRQPILGSS
jgi:hypothetical protein